MQSDDLNNNILLSFIFKIEKGEIFVSVDSMLKAIRDVPDIDIAETLKVHIHELQSKLQGLPTHADFKLKIEKDNRPPDG